MILPGSGKEPPRALGLVVTLQRRRIFVNLGQVTEIAVDGAHLHGGTVDLDRFTRRTGEILASELYGHHVEGGGTIVDVAISSGERQRAGWEVCALAVSRGISLLNRGPEIVPWDRHPELIKTDPLAEQLAQLREVQPADLATAVEELPPTRRSQIAAALDDEQLADVLEEMPEQDQVPAAGEPRARAQRRRGGRDAAGRRRGPAGRDARRAARTAADGDGGRPGRGPAQAAAVRPEEGGRPDDLPAADRDPGHAGGRGAGPDQEPGDAGHLGRAGVRLRAARGAPTGRYLGSVGFQRLLRLLLPSTLVGQCVEASVFIRAGPARA